MLNTEEKQRLDELLTSARRFHHWSFVIAGISLAISSLETFEVFTLPIGNVSFSTVQTSVGLLLVTILLCLVADRLYYWMARPWTELDDKRLQFAWFALGQGYEIWLRLPIMIASVATTIALKNSMFLFLAFGYGWMLVHTPRFVYHYAELFDGREDHRGGPATYSMKLYYWVHIIRYAATFFVFIFAILISVPKFKAIAVISTAIAFVIRPLAKVG